jgi:hypothetical protein
MCRWSCSGSPAPLSWAAADPDAWRLATNDGKKDIAGVWRIIALGDSGVWMERTTTEDMDFAVQAHLKGWVFLFLNDVEVLLSM